MNFRKDFTNIEETSLDNLHSTKLKGAMEKSSAWVLHTSKCNDPKAMFFKLGNEKIVLNDERNVLLDDELWRKNLEEKSKLMLNEKNMDLIENSKPELIMSENFSIISSSREYENQLLTIGCMCGVEVNLDPRNLEGNYVASSLSGSYISSEKTGKMTYE